MHDCVSGRGRHNAAVAGPGFMQDPRCGPGSLSVRMGPNSHARSICANRHEAGKGRQLLQMSRDVGHAAMHDRLISLTFMSGSSAAPARARTVMHVDAHACMPFAASLTFGPGPKPGTGRGELRTTKYALASFLLVHLHAEPPARDGCYA